MKRHVLLFVLATTLLIATMAACGAPSAAPTPNPAPPTAMPVDFPVTITDDLGREVTLSVLPQRIVSLVPSSTEILFAVGAGEQVVGVTEYCNYPPEAQNRDKIGGYTADTISVEKTVSLEPDLVFSDGLIHPPVIEALEQTGIVVFASDPHGFEDVYANIEAVGQLTGHAAEAVAVVEEMKGRVAAVTEKTQAIPDAERPTVFYEVWYEPLMTAGPTTFAGRLIELAGGKNIFADLSEEYPQVSAETLLWRDPDVILGPDSHGDELTAEKIKSRPGWESITAAQENHIYLVDGDMVSRPGPRLADVLEDIAEALHPDLFQ